MSLFGSCEDCGESASLRYKPAVPLNQQSRPSVCPSCHHNREAQAREHSHDQRGF